MLLFGAGFCVYRKGASGSGSPPLTPAATAPIYLLSADYASFIFLRRLRLLPCFVCDDGAARSEPRT